MTTGSVAGAGRLEHDLPVFDQIKTVRGFAFAKNNLSGIEVREKRAIRQQTHVMRAESNQEWMRGYRGLQFLTALGGGAAAV